ncbi:hypothetical protein LUU34_00149500 [Aix galericulata]|nr:hypothetical protein LUU34_00149500 [Aix galericulata]
MCGKDFTRKEILTTHHRVHAEGHPHETPPQQSSALSVGKAMPPSAASRGTRGTIPRRKALLVGERSPLRTWQPATSRWVATMAL